MRQASDVSVELVKLLDNNNTLGYNKVKAVYDKSQALVQGAATTFQSRIIEDLTTEQPVRKLLEEIVDARRHPALFQAATRTASAAKNIADFCDRELQGHQPLRRPCNEKEAIKHRRKRRPREYCTATYVAGGSQDPSDDEGEGYKRPECGKGSPFNRRFAKRPRTVINLADLPPPHEETLAAAAEIEQPATTPPTVLAKPVEEEPTEATQEGEVIATGIAVDDDGDSSSDSDLEL